MKNRYYICCLEWFTIELFVISDDKQINFYKNTICIDRKNTLFISKKKINLQKCIIDKI